MLWGLRPVEQLATYGLVVDNIRRQIQLGLLLPEERLAAERKLAFDMNISRVTLREALRVLETEGYISVRRGVQGGTFVSSEAGLDIIAHRFVSRDPSRILRALEYREATESSAAIFAARRRTPTCIRRMRVGLDAIPISKTMSELRRAENTFHIALGEASHNDLLAKGLEEALTTLFMPFGEMGDFGDLAERHEVRMRLLTAIQDRDESAAEKTCREILETERRRVRHYAKAA